MLAGGTAGVAMWSVAIPPDVSLTSHLGIMTRSGKMKARSCLWDRKRNGLSLGAVRW